MVSTLLNILTQGLKQLRSNARMALVVILVFVFPLLFVWITQSFYTTAYTNINTVEKQKVDILHESLAEIVHLTTDTSVLNTTLQRLVEERQELRKLEVAKDSPEGLFIIASNDSEHVGVLQSSTELFYAANSSPGNSFIFEYEQNGVRTWQAFRQVRFGSDTFYIFSEHDFSVVDAVMQSREQESYLGLTAIFFFLILLAYWLMRQDHWFVAYDSTKKKLDEQGLFANTIAHELRAPLTAIKGYSSFLLESKEISQTDTQHVKSITGASERLLTLINDFLEVARIQSGQLKLKVAPTDISIVINRVVKEFSAMASTKGLELKSELPQKHVPIDIDENRLQQVLTNLVSNAIKYTDKGSVTVALEQSRFNTTVRIKDTGHGISAEDQRRLFAPFTRVGGADNSSVTGTGLGMWITKQLVELLGGKISLESIEGVGTHVKVVFKA